MRNIAVQHARRVVYSLAIISALFFGVRSPAMAADASFVSADTVVIGCTAGGGAAAFAAVIPLMTTAFGAAGVPITPVVVAAWTGIGCAVGIVSGLIAIGTAWGFETWNEMQGHPATAP